MNQARSSVATFGRQWLNITLFLEMVVTSIIGFIPLALFLGTPLVPIIHAIGVGIITLLIIIKSSELPQGSPSFGEWIMSSMSSLYIAAMAGLYGFLLYGLIFGATKLVALVVGWFGGDIAPNAHAIAVWPGAIIGILFGWALIYPGFIALKNTLFSQQPGLRSPYYALVTNTQWIKRTLMWVVVILVISILIVVFFGVHSTPISIAGELFLLFAFQAPAFATRSQYSMSELRAIQSIAKLAYSSGLTKVVTMPRIGDPDVDQLLSTIQLFAGNNEKAFVAEIMTPYNNTEPVTASDALLLPIATKALAERLETTDGQRLEVTPVMVLVGRKPTASLWTFAESEGIQIIEIPDERSVTDIISMKDPHELQQAANQILYSGDNMPSSEINQRGIVQ